MRTFAGVIGTTMQNFTSFVMLPVLLHHHHTLKAQQVHSSVSYGYYRRKAFY